MEYNKVKISVPSNWGDISLGLFESLDISKPATSRDQVDTVAKLCNIEAELLLSWPAEVYSEIVECIYFIFEDNPANPSPEIEIEGVKYIVPIEDELTLGEWVDIDEVQKTETNVLSNVLAIVCRPIGESYNHKNNEARAAMFAELPVSKTQGVLAFFLRCKMVLDQRTAAYTNLVKIIGQLPTNIKPFRKPGGGIKLSTIWLTVKYYGMMLLLHYQLQKFLRTCNTKKIKVLQKTRNIN